MYDRGDYAQAREHFQKEFALACQIGDVSDARQLGGKSQLIFTTIGHKKANELK